MSRLREVRVRCGGGLRRRSVSTASANGSAAVGEDRDRALVRSVDGVSHGGFGVGAWDEGDSWGIVIVVVVIAGGFRDGGIYDDRDVDDIVISVDMMLVTVVVA